MAAAIARSLAKSRDGSARSIQTTNAYLPGENSVLEASHLAFLREGMVPGLMYDSLEAPWVDDLSDTGAVKAALLVARGDSAWVDIDRLASEIADPTTSASMARRFYLNQIVTGAREDSWLPAQAWQGTTVSRGIPDGAECVLGFDGSFSGDCTCVVAVSVPTTDEELPHLDVVQLWEKPEGAPDWRVPIVDVEECVRQACRRWRVLEIAADPYRWSRSLQILSDERLPVVEFPQSPARMTRATERFHQAVLNRTVTHSDNEALARHVDNCIAKVDSRGTRVGKRGKERHIDLAVAAIMAYDRASQQNIPQLLW
jgi:hypothetical protein